MASLSSNKNSISDEGRLIYFDYFRAFAILFIILGHCYNAWPRDQTWEAALVNFISGGTALFVFISGFFFHHVYFPKYRYWSFVNNKIKYVFIPYVVLSLLYIFYHFWLKGEVVMARVLNEFYGPGLSDTSLVIMNLLTGRTLWAYWYIPFAMLLFLLSPVFIRFIALKRSTKVILTCGLFILSMFVQRPVWEINPIHSLIYYIPYYLFGIIYSMERTKVNGWLQGKAVLLLLITVAVAFIMVLFGQRDNMGKASILAWHGIDLMILQKTSLIMFMLAFMMHLQQYKIQLLMTIAEMSFALYFLHQWSLSIMRRTGLMDFSHEFGGVILLFLGATLSSYLIARLIKKIFGKTSRHIIGW